MLKLQMPFHSAGGIIRSSTDSRCIQNALRICCQIRMVMFVELHEVCPTKSSTIGTRPNQRIGCFIVDVHHLNSSLVVILIIAPPCSLLKNTCQINSNTPLARNSRRWGDGSSSSTSTGDEAEMFAAEEVDFERLEGREPLLLFVPWRLGLVIEVFVIMVGMVW